MYTAVLRKAYKEDPKKVNDQDTNGNTALHWACMVGGVEFVKFLLSCPIIDPGLANNAKKTALQLVIGEGTTDILELLLGSGRVKETLEVLTAEELAFLKKRMPRSLSSVFSS